MSLSNDGNSFLCSHAYAGWAGNYPFAERRRGRKVFVVNALGIDPTPKVASHLDDMAVRLRWYPSEGEVSKSSINGGSLP